MKKKVILSVCVLLLCLAVCGCVRNVKFSSGDSYPSDASSLVVVTGEGETKKLNKFKELQNVDFSGSENYAEIIEWSSSHPDVEVTYTVLFPDGTVVKNTDTQASLTGVTEDQIQETMQLLTYLPDLKTCILSADNGITEESISELKAAYPEITFSFTGACMSKTVALTDTELDLTGLSYKQASDMLPLIENMVSLEQVNITYNENSFSLENITDFASNLADTVVINCNMNLYGEDINLADDQLILSHIVLEDNGAQVWEVLPLMRNCKLLDMDSCGVSDEDMAAIRDAFPDVKVVWRIWFGLIYSVRTDVETILASNPEKGGHLTPTASYSLRYCTDVKNLDVGHDEELTDISFVSYMPNLETLILYGAGFTDAKPLGTLTNLDYLELADNWQIADIRPLANCVNLKHLNIALCPEIKDMTALYNCTKLERLWIGSYTQIPQAQIDKMQSIVPDCEINTTCTNPVDGRWRYESSGGPEGDVLIDRYIQIRQTFGYSWDIESDDSMYAYYYNDPLYYHR